MGNEGVPVNRVEGVIIIIAPLTIVKEDQWGFNPIALLVQH